MHKKLPPKASFSCFTREVLFNIISTIAGKGKKDLTSLHN